MNGKGLFITEPLREGTTQLKVAYDNQLDGSMNSVADKFK